MLIPWGRATILCCHFSMLTACGGAPIGRTDHPERMPELVFAGDGEEATVEAVPNSYIVAFRPDIPTSMALHGSSFLQETKNHFQYLQPLQEDPGIANMDYLASLDLRAGLQKDPMTIDPPKTLQFALQANDFDPVPAAIVKVDFVDDLSAQTTLREWLDQGKIWYAEPNYMSQLSQEAQSFEELATAYEATAPAAPWFGQIKLVEGLKAMHELGAKLDHAPLVAVMDSGIDYLHPFLKPRIFENTNGINLAGCRNDQFGCNTTQNSKGVLGNGDVWPSGVSGPGTPCPEKGSCNHGTHVAGIIASSLQESFGGICPVCQILPVRIVGRTARGEGTEDGIIDSSIIAGFSYISRFKSGGEAAIRVVNASFGKFQRSRSVELLIRSLRSLGGGVVVVAAAGNEDTMKRQYPAAFNDVIAVANINAQDGVKRPTSNFGRWVDIAAPGGDSNACAAGGSGGILSTIPGDSNIKCSEGTSMASPVVAGVAGLLLAFNPQMGFDELKSRLIGTADPGMYEQPDNRPYYPNLEAERFPIPLLGAGIVNVENAVRGTVPDSKPISEALKRVTGECGVVRDRTAASKTWLWIIWFLPIGLLAVSKRLFSR